MTSPLKFLCIYLISLKFQHVFCDSHHFHSHHHHHNHIHLHLRASRILQGRPAGPAELPYQLSLRGNSHHYCGAVLVKSPITSKQFVLTAAECVVSNGRIADISQLSLLGGSTLQTDTTNDTGTAQIISIRKIVPYDKHRVDMSHRVPVPYNDIAIIFLSQPFEINPHVKPISLPVQEDELFYQKYLKISGWGKIEVNPSDYPSYLQVATVPVVEHEICAKKYTKVYKDQPVILQSNICAGGDGVGACHQDNGAPAVGYGYSASEEEVLLGIFSWGYGCGRPEFPGVYVRVSAYLNWITKIVVEETAVGTDQVASNTSRTAF